MNGASHIASSLSAILPILILMGTACVALMGDVFIWKRQRALTGIVALIGSVWALVVNLQQILGYGSSEPFSGSLVYDSLSQTTSLVLLIATVLSVLLAITYLRNRGLELGEYHVLLLFSASGAMLMGAANDLIMLFIGIEVLSVALYVLAGIARTEERSEEAAIKYFLLGAFASGFLLYGIALVYGATGTTNLQQINHLFSAKASITPILVAGIGLLIVGLGFKAALVPFHQWTPDVYEGAPTSVTAFMAAAAKVGAFAAFLRIMNAFMPVQPAWITAIQVLAILTMVFGNLLAVVQDNVKRMLAYSSIAHAGYVLVAVASTGMIYRHAVLYLSQGDRAAMFYLLAYVFMTVGAFGVLVLLSRSGKDYQTMNDLKGLARTHPFAAYTMMFFMLSLGGIPPTMGFLGKWLIFNAAISAHQVTLAIVMALASVVGIYYYLRVVWMMCFQEPEGAPATEHPVNDWAARWSVIVSLAGTLMFGVLPALLSPIMTGLYH